MNPVLRHVRDEPAQSGELQWTTQTIVLAKPIHSEYGPGEDVYADW